MERIRALDSTGSRSRAGSVGRPRRCVADEPGTRATASGWSPKTNKASQACPAPADRRAPYSSASSPGRGTTTRLRLALASEPGCAREDITSGMGCRWPYEGQNPGQAYVVELVWLVGSTSTCRPAVVEAQLAIEK